MLEIMMIFGSTPGGFFTWENPWCIVIIELLVFLLLFLIGIPVGIYFFSKRNKQEKFCGTCGSKYRIQLKSCPFCPVVTE